MTKWLIKYLGILCDIICGIIYVIIVTILSRTKGFYTQYKNIKYIFFVSEESWINKFFFQLFWFVFTVYILEEWALEYSLPTYVTFKSPLAGAKIECADCTVHVCLPKLPIN